MKTKILFLTIALILNGIFSFADGFEIKLNNVQDIDNISFIATTPFEDYFKSPLFIQEYSLKNEQLLDDTTINTKKIKKSESENLTIIKIEDEENINNIPFDTRKVFRQKISYPEFARKMKIEGIVCVCFTYNEFGYLDVLSTNSSHDELNKYIIDQLSGIRLRNGSVKVGKEYFAKFNFKIL
ncbi:MAG: hypothetical protein K8R58_05665 [Bacteroidales bacterium]|nr:hypothetical protein [Bacteroidales bacterium]